MTRDCGVPHTAHKETPINALGGAQKFKVSHSFHTSRQTKGREGTRFVRASVDTQTQTWRNRLGGLLRFTSTTKHTVSQIKSQINESLRMGKQHTMFASYIAPA